MIWNRAMKSEHKKKTLPKAVFIDTEQNFDVIPDDPIPTTHEILSGFYNELYQKFIEHAQKTEGPLCQKIEEAVSVLSKRDDLGMVLHMFKKIAPTLCDEKPIDFLMLAIKEVDELHDFNRISTFMQIASFRWAYLEKGFKTRASTKRGQEGKSLLDTPENRCWGAAFGLILDPPDYKYDVDKLNHHYIEKIIKPLVLLSIQFAQGNVINGEDLLHKYLDKIAKKHPEEEERNKKIFQILKKGKKIDADDFSKIVDLTSQNEILKRKIRDKCRDWCNVIQEMNNVIWFKSIQRGFDLLDLEQTYWKKLPPWPISDILNDNRSITDCEIAIITESMLLN